MKLRDGRLTTVPAAVLGISRIPPPRLVFGILAVIGTIFPILAVGLIIFSPP